MKNAQVSRAFSIVDFNLVLVEPDFYTTVEEVCIFITFNSVFTVISQFKFPL